MHALRIRYAAHYYLKAHCIHGNKAYTLTAWLERLQQLWQGCVRPVAELSQPGYNLYHMYYVHMYSSTCTEA